MLVSWVWSMGMHLAYISFVLLVFAGCARERFEGSEEEHAVVRLEIEKAWILGV